MQDIDYITPDFAVTGELDAADFQKLAEMGFRSVINNRPDAEEDGQLQAHVAAAHAWRAGLAYRHLPVTKLDLFTDEVIEATAAALRDLDGPILAHCKSGLRSAIVWAATAARQRPVDEVMDLLDAAFFDLRHLRDDLDQQADRARWMPQSEPAGGGESGPVDIVAGARAAA